MVPRAPCFLPGPSSIATPLAFRCATTSSGVLEVRKQRSSLPAASWSAVNHSTLSAPFGRTLIFWFPNTSEVRLALPAPGSNTLISMPRISAYHSAERATSLTLITRWSSALTLTGMASSLCRNWLAPASLAHRAWLVTTPSTSSSRTSKNGRCFDDFTPRRIGLGRDLGSGHVVVACRRRRRLSDTADPLPGRLSPGRGHRHHRAADRPAPVGKARPAIRGREQAWRRQQYRHRGCGERRARRLHRAAGQPRQFHQHLALHQSQVQLR